jgi:hypothetical protein
MEPAADPRLDCDALLWSGDASRAPMMGEMLWFGQASEHGLDRSTQESSERLIAKY